MLKKYKKTTLLSLLLVSTAASITSYCKKNDKNDIQENLNTFYEKNAEASKGNEHSINYLKSINMNITIENTLEYANEKETYKYFKKQFLKCNKIHQKFNVSKKSKYSCENIFHNWADNMELFHKTQAPFRKKSSSEKKRFL
ncbi:hypothetical protein KAH94_06175 [bacterium]|nr:hypothetical protein [bacterium]